MKKSLTLVAFGLTSLAFSQEKNHFSQYSLEVAYGINHASRPNLTGLHHFDVGFRYMYNEFWGAKIDYGYDMYVSNDSRNAKTTQNRFSLQAVYNLGRALRVSDVAPEIFNVLLHAGGGPTMLKTEEGHTDKGTNVIIGGTGQFYIAPQLALTADLSGILNFRQNYRYDGTGRYDYFTGKSATFSVGLTYYFGRNGSTSDWH